MLEEIIEMIREYWCFWKSRNTTIFWFSETTGKVAILFSILDVRLIYVQIKKFSGFSIATGSLHAQSTAWALDVFGMLLCLTLYLSEVGEPWCVKEPKMWERMFTNTCKNDPVAGDLEGDLWLTISRDAYHAQARATTTKNPITRLQVADEQTRTTTQLTTLQVTCKRNMVLKLA